MEKKRKRRSKKWRIDGAVRKEVEAETKEKGRERGKVGKEVLSNIVTSWRVKLMNRKVL